MKLIILIKKILIIIPKIILNLTKVDIKLQVKRKHILNQLINMKILVQYTLLQQKNLKMIIQLNIIIIIINILYKNQKKFPSQNLMKYLMLMSMEMDIILNIKDIKEIKVVTDIIIMYIYLYL